MKKSLLALALSSTIGFMGIAPANSYDVPMYKPLAAHLGISQVTPTDEQLVATMFEIEDLSYSITDASQKASGDEYFYRLSNQDGELVDSSSAEGMVGPLTEQAQDDYYVEKLFYAPFEYDWAWVTFICVANGTITAEVPGINMVVKQAPKSATLSEYNAFWNGEDFVAPQGVLETFQTVALDNNYQPEAGPAFTTVGSETRLLISKHSAIATCSEGTPTVATLAVDGQAVTPRSFNLNQQTQALVNGSYRSIDLQGRYVGVFGAPQPELELEPEPAANPEPYSGPLITNINGAVGPYSTFGGEQLRVNGDRLSSTTKVFIDGKEGTVVSTADDHFVMITPEGLSAGEYDLVVESSIGNLRFLNAFVVTQDNANKATALAACQGAGTTWWTKRISDTQAKAYIKCPEVGQKYRILQQTGGSGEYTSIFAKTLTDENDTTQVFNEFGRYIVRTIDLEDINRIRITVGDEELWKVRYNR